MKQSLVPSLPAQSFEEIRVLLGSLQGLISGVQIDIVDGVFAPTPSWPFTTNDHVAALRELTPYHDLEIEMDCMCMHPEMYLDTFVEIGVKRVVIHAGSTTQYAECIAHARAHGYRIGFAIQNDTEKILCDTYIPQFDFVQVMGILHIGVQGQPFDVRTVATVGRLRKQYPSLEIAVDGGVNEETIPALLAAGVNRFAPGSAISRADDPGASYKHLLSLIQT